MQMGAPAVGSTPGRLLNAINTANTPMGTRHANANYCALENAAGSLQSFGPAALSINATVIVVPIVPAAVPAVPRDLSMAANTP
jgi:hypothetical protein